MQIVSIVPNSRVYAARGLGSNPTSATRCVISGLQLALSVSQFTHHRMGRVLPHGVSVKVKSVIC